MRSPGVSQLRPRFPKGIPLALPCPPALTVTGVDIIEGSAETLEDVASLNLPLGASPNPSAVKNESGSNGLPLGLARQMGNHPANRAMKRMPSPMLLLPDL